MTINETIIKDLEHKYRKLLPDELKKYLLVQYAEEPFPDEYTEQDLFSNIERDLHAYEAGELDITLKSTSQRWQQEREYLQSLYLEMCYEARELADYVAALEQIIAQYGLESPKMAKRWLELSSSKAFSKLPWLGAGCCGRQPLPRLW